MFEKEAYEYGKVKIDLATSMMNPQIETATRQGFRKVQSLVITRLMNGIM